MKLQQQQQQHKRPVNIFLKDHLYHTEKHYFQRPKSYDASDTIRIPITEPQTITLQCLTFLDFTSCHSGRRPTGSGQTYFIHFRFSQVYDR